MGVSGLFLRFFAGILLVFLSVTWRTVSPRTSFILTSRHPSPRRPLHLVQENASLYAVPRNATMLAGSSTAIASGGHKESGDAVSPVPA
jgi:uncharacterized membrane protein YphA (DoxX/SURF4 family)